MTEIPPTPSPVPPSWLARVGQLTPSGGPATYRSNPHALMGLRLAYRQYVLGETTEMLSATAARYQASWERYVRHGHDMCRVVASLTESDLEGAASVWNAIDQPVVNDAFRVVLGERELINGKNLVTHVWNEYRLVPLPSVTVPFADRDRSLRPSDSNAAWSRSDDGLCRGCETPTISHAQRDRLHAAMRSNSDMFDLTPTYFQFNGVAAPLWPQATIAAKGVAEHVVPRSQGGRTNPGNLTNCCAGCNYARGDTSMDASGVAAYDRPAAETAWIEPGRWPTHVVNY